MNCNCKCGCDKHAVNNGGVKLWAACFGCGLEWLNGARKHGPQGADKARIGKIKIRR